MSTPPPAAERASHRIARHALFNLLGQGLPSIAGLATIPILVRELGKDSYGAFSLAWVMFGYFGLLDLGLSRATTHLVADYQESAQTSRLRSLVKTSLWVQALLGVVGAVLLVVAVPWGVTVLGVPPSLRPSVSSGFYLLAGGLPVLLLASALRGVLEGLRRFELLNLIRIPASLALLVLPAIAALLGWGFVGAVAGLLTARVMWLVLVGVTVARLLPPGEAQPRRESVRMIRTLLGFGGWITVTNVISPLMVYLDRFLIGSRLTLTQVSYYAAPYDVVARLQLIPASLVSVLFPEFSALAGGRDRVVTERLVIGSVRVLLGLMGLALVVLLPLSSVALGLWLGPEFRAAGTWPTRLLLIGICINALAWVPITCLQGGGRPDLPAKGHTLEFPLYLAALWLLIGKLGIAGAALAWLLRVTCDALLLFWFAQLVGGPKPREVMRRLGPMLLTLSAVVLPQVVLTTAETGIGVALAAAAGGAVVWCAAWFRLLPPPDRATMLNLAQRLRPRISPRTTGRA